MRNGWNENRALLRGRVAEAPTFSHENHDVTYWMFPLEVKRLSGAADRVNVLLPGTLLSEQAVMAPMGVNQQLMQIIGQWLRNHILKPDAKFVACLERRGCIRP